MPLTAPKTDSKSTFVRQVRDIACFASRDIDTPPTDKDLVINWIPDSWTWVANGEQLNSIRIIHDFSREDSDRITQDLVGLKDLTTPVAWERQVELRQKDEDGFWSKLLAWGFLSQQHGTLSDFDESLTLDVRLEKHHFGVPLTSYPIMEAGNTGDEQRIDIERPLVWNPERMVNGTPRVMGNRSDRTDASDDTADPPYVGHDWNYVIDPDSLRTDLAETYQYQTASSWNLAEAALALCWWCNPDEEWIENPTREEIELILPTDTMLKNQDQPYGDYLPDALDKLLAPHGCGWFLDNYLERTEGETDDDEPTFTRHSKIRFYKKGEGKKAVLLRQRSGAKDISKTKVHNLNVDLSVVDMANRIQVFGDFEKTESTWPLVRGWDNNGDTLNALDLERGAGNEQNYPWTGRKYVLNEAADYCQLRVTRQPADYDADTEYPRLSRVMFAGEVWMAVVNQDASNSPADFPDDWLNLGPYTSANEQDEPYDLSPYFTADSLAVRRRRFLPCISEKSDGDDAESNRYVIEWLNPNGRQAPVAWNSTRQWAIGELVSFEDNVYACADDNTNIEPDSDDTKWVFVGPVTPEFYNPANTYYLHDVVVYNDIYYRCATTFIVGSDPETFPQFWTEVVYPYEGAKWERLKGQVSILEHECGILFEGARIPEELWNCFRMSPPRDRVRITCSIQGDRRVQGVATRRDDSPNNQDIQLTLYLDDKFQKTVVHANSKFAGGLNHARDDSTACQTYAETVRDLEDCADLTTRVILEGISHPELRPGVLVTKIEGVEISLNARSDAQGVEPRYPQIVGFEFNRNDNTTTLMLESFKKIRPEPTVAE